MSKRKNRQANRYRNYTINLLRMLQSKRMLVPLTISYCITTNCNLNCRYCEDFGARRNPEQHAPLSLDGACRLLSLLRTATDSLTFTGGEPLLYPEIDALVRYAKHTAGFRELTMITNGLLLSQHQEILGTLDRLIVSLDSVNPELWDPIIRVGPGAAQHILETVVAVAKQQEQQKFHMVAHCVITPETLSQARDVLDFCVGHNIAFSFSPQSVNNWPHYDLLTSDAYRDFVAYVIQYKRRKAPILGSMAYLRLMFNFEPYACHPLLAPRVMPEGSLSYPCRPVERSGDTHGGRINLLEAGSWQAALAQAHMGYGDPPMTCSSCYQQCYVEPSLMQAHPQALLKEWLIYPTSRAAHILTYVPG